MTEKAEGDVRVRRTVLAAVLVAVAVVGMACSSGGDGDDGGGEGADATATTLDVQVGEKGYGAVIRRTTDGVPHIVGADLRSVAFGQGWASGQDHACTLADQVMRVTSTRAEHLGPGVGNANVESDLAWKALGLAGRAAQEWPEQPEDVRELVTAFADGWNAQLADVGPTGVVGWCAGADWLRPVTPEELYLYARSITLQASGARLLPYLHSAQPPSGGAGPVAAPASTPVTDVGLAGPAMASNGWAIGSERSESGGGLLLSNPHFPWEGELRFWEVHLTVPGDLDVYGAQLVGLPGIAVGFNEGMAWTHTVSAGNRFTAYTVDLAPGDPTSYLVDGTPVPMTSEDVTVRVRRDDGGTEVRNWTVWRTEFGPVLDFPGIGWTEQRTLTYRDANIDNDEFLSQYLAILRAEDLDDMRAAQRRHQGVPLFNTIAVGADGEAWYADTSATPNLSPEAVAAYQQRLETDLIAATAAQARVVLLDGSSSRDRWVDVEGARDPGLVPWDGQPMTDRRDYLFNANDSFWLPNADHVLEGDYSPLHGTQATERSVRTRQNAVVLRDTSDSGPAGEGGLFDLAELRDAALADTAFTAVALKEELVGRCRAAAAAGPVEVPELSGPMGAPPLAAGPVDIAPACDVLAGWDSTFDVDSRGAVLWREAFGRLDQATLWAQPFDPAEPVATPSGLAPPPAEGPDPVPQVVARAVQVLERAGLPLDVPLGQVQIDGRVPDQRLPVPGGLGSEGITNVVSDAGGTPPSSSEPVPETPAAIAARSELTVAGTYPIVYGTSFLLAVEYTDDGPRASSILTYGQTDDRSSPLFTSQMRRFAAKDWKDVLYTDAAIREDPELEVTRVKG